MLPDITKGVVNVGFGDDEVEGVFGPAIGALLRRAPLDQRQNVILELDRRTLKIEKVESETETVRTKITQAEPLVISDTLEDILEENHW